MLKWKKFIEVFFSVFWIFYTVTTVDAGRFFVLCAGWLRKATVCVTFYPINFDLWKCESAKLSQAPSLQSLCAREKFRKIFKFVLGEWMSFNYVHDLLFIILHSSVVCFKRQALFCVVKFNLHTKKLEIIIFYLDRDTRETQKICVCIN